MTLLSQHTAPEQTRTVATVGPSAPPVLAVRDVRISDRVTEREIVRGVSFELTPGKAVGIVGESGSGKTLTCRPRSASFPRTSRSPAAPWRSTAPTSRP